MQSSRYFCQILMKFDFPRHIYEKYSQLSAFMKIRTAGAELFHADGRTDTHDKAYSRFSTFCGKHLKSWNSLSQCRHSPHSVITQGSSSCSQNPLTDRYPQKMIPVHTFQSYFFTIHFHSILPSTPRSYKLPLSFKLYNQTARVTCPTPLSVSDHPNIWRADQGGHAA